MLFADDHKIYTSVDKELLFSFFSAKFEAGSTFSFYCKIENKLTQCLKYKNSKKIAINVTKLSESFQNKCKSYYSFIFLLFLRLQKAFGDIIKKTAFLFIMKEN